MKHNYKKSHERNASKDASKQRKFEKKKDIKKDKTFDADGMNDQYNDISWWANNPQLIKDVASIPFNVRLGHPIDLYNGNSKPIDPSGVLQVEMMPSIGCPSEKSDAPNVAAKLIYSFIRHQNSGSTNYYEADLLMMMLAHASAVSMIELAKRAYGTIFTYSAYNTYVPRDLIIAMGFDPDDLIDNIAQFRAKINYYTRKLSAIRVPKGWPIAERWRSLNESYYLDEDSPKAQIYVPCLNRYFVWNAKAMSTGSCLERRRCPAKMTVGQWSAMMDLITERLINDEEIGIMSGDIIKAYGMENTMDIPMISEDYTTVPLRSAEFLTAIHNAHFNAVNEFLDTEGLDVAIPIFQDEEGTIKESNYICWSFEGGTFPEATPVQAAVFAMNPKNRRVLDMYGQTTTPEAVLLATRFAGPTAELHLPLSKSDGIYATSASDYNSEAVSVDASSYAAFRLTHGGTEILNAANMVSDGEIRRTNVQEASMLNTVTNAEVRTIAQLVNFNYAPIVYRWSYSDYTSEATSAIQYVLAQFDNYTQYDEATLARINDMALLSAFTKTTGTAV